MDRLYRNTNHCTILLMHTCWCLQCSDLLISREITVAVLVNFCYYFSPRFNNLYCHQWRRQIGATLPVCLGALPVVLPVDLESYLLINTHW